MTEDALGRVDALRLTAEQAREGESSARKVAESALDALGKEREKLIAFEYGRTIQVAHQEWRENNAAGALALLAGTKADLRGWEWRYVHRLCNSQLLTLEGHTGRIRSASFSPDGTRVVTAGDDGTARVWDARTGAEVLTLKGHTSKVQSASFSPDGVHILTIDDDDAVRIWDSVPIERSLRPKELAPPPRPVGR